MDGSSFFYAESRFFSFYDESSISSYFLQAIDYLGPRQRIRCQINEFAKACLFLRLTDSEKVCVGYTFQNKPVEHKSPKYYFISYRNDAIFQEDLTSRIFIDLIQLLKPE